MSREDEQYSDEERDQEQIQEEDNGLKRKREDDNNEDAKKQKYDYDARAAYTVMLRNLSYNTSDDSIKEKLSKYGNIVRVNIPTDERGRSRGYGFVEFDEVEAATKVVDLKAMEMDGREVQLQQSKARDEFSGRTTQVFVGNLPESAEEQDIRELFEQCGEIDEVRMPKDKDTEKKKGFAFVQFRDSSSVKAALEKDGSEFKGVNIRVNEEKSTRNKQRRDRFDDRRGGRGGGDRRGGRGGNRRYDDRRGGDRRGGYEERRGGGDRYGDDRRGGDRRGGDRYGDDRRGGERRYERR